MAALEVKVPDIGDFADVPVIEIHVSVGDEVAPEDPLVTLESDKATMDIPAPSAGKVTDLRVALEDKVSEGSVILVLDAVDGAVAPRRRRSPRSSRRSRRPRRPSRATSTRARRSSSSDRAPAATRRRSAPPTWACRPRSSSATRRSAACA